MARKHASEQGVRGATMPGVTEDDARAGDGRRLRRDGRPLAAGRRAADRVPTTRSPHLPARQRHDLRARRPRRDRRRRAAHRARARSATCPAARASSRRSPGRDGSSPETLGAARPDRRACDPHRRGRTDRRRQRRRSAPASWSCSTAHGEAGTNLAELGVGTNDAATLTGNVLEDEKILGTVHVAFGASAGIGGTVSVPIHLDVVIARREPRDRRDRRCSTAAAGARRSVTHAARGPQLLRGPRPRRRSTRSRGAFGAGAARRPRRPRPPPQRVHGRRRPRRAGRARAQRRPRGRAAADRPPPPRRRPPAGRCPRRRPDRLPRPTRPRGRVRRGAGPRRPAERASSGCRCSSTASSAEDAPAPSCAAAARPRSPSGWPGELRPDFGRRAPDPPAGAVLVGARPPLVAFNLELTPPAALDDARRIAAQHPGGRRRGASRACARSGLWLEHAADAPRCRPTSRTTARPRWPRVLAAVARHGAGRRRPSSSASLRARPSTAFPRRSRSATAARSRTPARQRLKLQRPWRRPRRSAAASIAAPPRARSSPRAHRPPADRRGEARSRRAQTRASGG